jgi:uncharacterized protein (TIGR03643 family)
MKKPHRPFTKSKNPEPKDKTSINWIIWAALADRITFEDIKRQTGKSESEVIDIMRKNLKPSSFKNWRKRVHTKSLKNLKIFRQTRKDLRDPSYKKISFDDKN